jgi:hypothetical protein
MTDESTTTNAKGYKGDPARIRSEQRAAEAAGRAAQGLPPEAPSKWTMGLVTVIVGGLVLALLGVIILFTTNNIFVGILGGTITTSGMAWLGSGLARL